MNILKRISILFIILLSLTSCGSHPDNTYGTTSGSTGNPNVKVEEERSSAAPESAPSRTRLDVPYISQEGLLPTGCELVSAMMVLAYYGENPTLEETLDHLKTANLTLNNQGEICGPSPEEAFIGDPRSAGGYGCYPPVIVNLMGQLLPQGRKAVETSGTSLPDLAETYLPRGIPVLVWATIGMMETYPTSTWQLTDESGRLIGKTYTWQANEHCLVLIGYDENSFYFNDPWRSRGVVAYDRNLAEGRYDDLGDRSLVVE